MEILIFSIKFKESKTLKTSTPAFAVKLAVPSFLVLPFAEKLTMFVALAVAKELNIPFGSIMNIKLRESASGRNRSIVVHGVTILDETYNSSPESVIALLNYLITMKGRRFAVFGNMYELGSESLNSHKLIVMHAVKLGITGLIVCGVGPDVEAMYKECEYLRYIELVSTPEEAFLILRKWLRPGDFLLLKASRKVALERLVPLLKAL